MFNKRKVSLCLVIVMLFSAIFTITAPRTEARAETFDDAVEISVNQTVTGNVTKGSNYQQNYYQFSAPMDGYIYISFGSELQKNSNAYWVVRLYDDEFNEVDSTKIYGNTTQTDSTKIGVSQGNTYYVKVNSAKSSTRDVSTDNYLLTVVFVEDDSWESEFNGNFAAANRIEANRAYWGTIRSGYDYEHDYYVCQIPSNGAIRVVFGNELQKKSSAYWVVYLYDYEYSKYYKYSITGNLAEHELPWVGVEGDHDYYICVESPRYNVAGSTEEYCITLEFTESDDWEKEYNDDFTSATEIKKGQTYSGTIRSGYDYEKDYYSIDLENGEYEFCIEYAKKSSSAVYWKVGLYNANYEKLEEFSCKGNVNTTSITKNLKAGKYYVLIKSPNYNSAKTTDIYQITVKEHTSELKSISLNKKSIKLKKGKTYQLYYSTNPSAFSTSVTWKSSNKKIATVSKTGLVKAKKTGSCKITVTTKEGKTATCKVTVK